MQNHIHLARETHFGCTRYYLSADHHDEAFAYGLSRLTGRKSITETDIEGLRMLGFHVHLADQPTALKPTPSYA